MGEEKWFEEDWWADLKMKPGESLVPSSTLPVDPLVAAGFVNSTSTSTKPTLEDTNWFKNRREQAAKASRTARQKRKREVEKLREENKRLRDERHDFLSKIEQLQLQLEVLRKEREHDGQRENDLLKLQLQAHQEFVDNFMKLAGGMPNSDLSKLAICKQGAEFAQTHALSLLSQSVREEWREAKLPEKAEHLRRRLRMCFKFVDGMSPAEVCPRMQFRIDMNFCDVNALEVAEMYWKSWTEEKEQAKTYHLREDNKFDFKTLFLEQTDEQDALVSAGCYREFYPPPEKDKDWVFVAARLQKRMARSTFLKHDPDEKFGPVDCHMLVRTTTQQPLLPADKRTERLSSLLAEGCVVFNENDEEKRKARLVTVCSMPDDIKFRSIEGIRSVVDAEGKITEKFLTFLTSFSHRLTS